MPQSPLSCISIDEVSKDRVSFFSNQLYKAMKGLGTDEDTLTRIMVSRCEVDLVQVKQTFASTYGKSLYSFISVRLPYSIPLNNYLLRRCNSDSTES